MLNPHNSGPWPDVAVCIPTFNRAGIVARTVELLLQNLSYSGRVSILVGCDGSDDTVERLIPLTNQPATRPVVMFGTPTGGIGPNVNRLVHAALDARNDYIITLDDDHHLIAPLCLDRHVLKLRDDASAGRIHLLMEARHDEHFDSYKFRAVLDSDHYWRVAWDSPEHFIMSFRPNLTHRRWWEVMGFLPEGLKTGQTEWQYAAHCKQVGRSWGGVDVLVPLCAYGFDHWAHENGGVSWNRMGL